MLSSLKEWWDQPHRDLLSGLVVAFALIPEAIAFSGIAGVDPQVGLFGAFCLAVTASIVGGRIAMILLAKDWVQQIPMATLVGVMLMVAASTANWSSLREIRRAPKSDTSVMVLTLLITLITHNLAIGVLSGVALAAILFSRKVAKVIAVTHHDSPLPSGGRERRYAVVGQLFFVSVTYFKAGFDLHDHPERVVIDLHEAHLWDQSCVAALDQVIRRYRSAGSVVDVCGLNPASADLFERIGASAAAA